jgi:hypothetical protein
MVTILSELHGTHEQPPSHGLYTILVTPLTHLRCLRLTEAVMSLRVYFSHCITWAAYLKQTTGTIPIFQMTLNEDFRE